MKKIYLLVIFFYIHHHLNAQIWQTMADVPEDLSFPVVVELRGNIHVLGGGAAAGASDLHLRYQPALNTWDTLPPVPYLAQQPAGSVVNDKIHFCGGGYPTTGQRLDLHYYYDPDSVQWYQAASLPVATAIHKAVSFDGKMYVLSGQPDKTLCEYYEPINNTWYQKNALPDQDFWYGAITATSNSIFRFGGGAYFAPSKKAHQYDKINDTWISLPDLPIALHALAGINMNDSLICISGGYANGLVLKKVWIYNINTQVYYFSDSLPVARNYHNMVMVDSCLYVVGGYNPANASIGVSLIKNCAPGNLSVISILDNELSKPYKAIITPFYLQLQLNSAVINSPAAIKLIDITGKTVLVKSINKENGMVTIDSKGLSAGMYIAILVIGDHTFIEQWIVSGN